MAEAQQIGDGVSSDCIFELFKVKVVEAVNLVKHISTENQVEAWHFWEDVSKLVKTVTAGVESVTVRLDPGDTDLPDPGDGTDVFIPPVHLPSSYQLSQTEVESGTITIVTVMTDRGTNVSEYQLPQEESPAKKTKKPRGRPRKKKNEEDVKIEALTTDLDDQEKSVAEASKLLEKTAAKSPASVCDTCGRKICNIVKTRAAAAKARVLDNSSCEGCGKKPTARKRVRKRPKTEKFEDVVFICSLCQTNFTSENDLHNHNSHVHDGRAEPLKTEEFDDEDGEMGDPDWTAERKSPRRNRRRRKKWHVDGATDGAEEGESLVKRPIRKNCDQCGAVLSSEASLEVHMRIHSGEKPFKCGQCDQTFSAKCNMQRHERSHSGNKPYKCPECNKYFTEKKSVKVHLRTHTGEKPYKCTICEKSFSQTGVLQSHMHLHTGHKGHLCDFCGKAFRQKSQMRIHQKRHFNNRPFKCDLCESAFISKGDLCRHRLRHTGERPFLCTHCPKTFTRMQYLKEHMNHHTGTKPYSCKECSASFHDMSTYHRHMRKHKTDEDDDNIKQEAKDHRVTLVFQHDGDTNQSKRSVATLLLSARQAEEMNRLGRIAEEVEVDEVSEHAQIPVPKSMVTQTSHGEMYEMSCVDHDMLASGELADKKPAEPDSREVSDAVNNVTLLLDGIGHETTGAQSNVTTLLLSAEELARLENQVSPSSRTISVVEPTSLQSQVSGLAADHSYELQVQQSAMTEFSQLPAPVQDSGMAIASENRQTYQVTYVDPNTMRETHSVMTAEDLTAMNLLAYATSNQF